MGRLSLTRKLDEVGVRPEEKVKSWKHAVESTFTPTSNQILPAEKKHNETIIMDTTRVSSISTTSNLAEEISENMLQQFPSATSAQKKLLTKKLYQIIFDNLDFFIQVKHMTSENRNKSIHWVNVLLVLDRVSADHLDDTQPLKSVFDLFYVDFVPTMHHNAMLLEAIVPLFARVIVKNMPAFSGFKNIVERHILHQYSDVIKEASDQVRNWLTNTMVIFICYFFINLKPTL